MTLDTSNWDGKFKVKKSQVEVIGNINVKNRFFSRISLCKRIDPHQTTAK